MSVIFKHSVYADVVLLEKKLRYGGERLDWG